LHYNLEYSSQKSTLRNISEPINKSLITIESLREIIKTITYSLFVRFKIVNHKWHYWNGNSTNCTKKKLKIFGNFFKNRKNYRFYKWQCKQKWWHENQIKQIIQDIKPPKWLERPFHFSFTVPLRNVLYQKTVLCFYYFFENYTLFNAVKFLIQ